MQDNQLPQDLTYRMDLARGRCLELEDKAAQFSDGLKRTAFAAVPVGVGGFVWFQVLLWTGAPLNSQYIASLGLIALSVVVLYLGYSRMQQILSDLGKAVGRYKGLSEQLKNYTPAPPRVDEEVYDHEKRGGI